MKLTGYGKREWLSATVIALIFTAVFLFFAIFYHVSICYYLAVLAVIVWFAVAGFFRDPNRQVPQGNDLIISPADGVVKDIELVRAVDNPLLSPVFEGQDMLRIGIFLSVFNVHINRAPCPMTVKLVEHKDGKYYDARDVRAGKENESQVIAGIAEAGGQRFPIAVRQVSGAIARRIVCPVELERQLSRGEKYGMIKFGSRTEVYLPAKNKFDVRVQIGDHVQGGITVLASTEKA